MTDIEITRWLAEKVMGLHEMSNLTSAWADSSGVFIHWNSWAPLTDPRACAEVMEVLRAKGLYWQLTAMDDGTYRCNLYRSDGLGAARPAREGTWTRALCLAAVWATGGEV